MAAAVQGATQRIDISLISDRIIAIQIPVWGSSELPDKRRDVSRGGGSKAVQVVAAFESRDHAAASVLSGDVHHGIGEIGKVLVRQGEASQQVAFTRIEAGGNEHEFRAEA